VEEYPEEASTHHELNDLVKIKLRSETGNEKYFLGNVVENETEERRYKIRFLRRKGRKETYFVYPDIEDVALVYAKEVLMKVKVRDLRRGSHAFDDEKESGIALE